MDRRPQQVQITRRSALAAAGASALALAMPANAEAQALKRTPLEEANVKVVEAFIAAWNARDGEKAMSFFTDDAQFGLATDTAPMRPLTKPNFAALIKGAKRLNMTITPGTTWARGSVVVHERTDEIESATGSTGATGRLVAVFTLRDGKIVHFLDFVIARPPYKD